MKNYPNREIVVAAVFLGGAEKIDSPEDVKRALPILVYFGEGLRKLYPLT